MEEMVHMLVSVLTPAVSLLLELIGAKSLLSMLKIYVAFSMIIFPLSLVTWLNAVTLAVILICNFLTLFVQQSLIVLQGAVTSVSPGKRLPVITFQGGMPELAH